MPKKENVSKMFDSIAGDYDRLNHILSLDVDKSWRKKAVKEIVGGSDAPLRILDMACGTGDFAMAIARDAVPGSRITGADISEGMLAEGRKKVEAAGLCDMISLEAGDCEHLDFPDGSFDRVSIAFGIRNFEHIDKGLSEMYRILRPGGKAVILELSVPGNPVLLAAYKLYFLHLLPVIGGLVSGDKDAYRYLPASVLGFPAPEKFKGMMREAGFSDVRATAMTFGICRMFTGAR